MPVMKRDVGSDVLQHGQDDFESITVQTSIFGIILISIGLLYTFFGIRFFKITVFLVGFYIGAILAWIVLTNVEPSDGYGNSSGIIYLAVTLVTGLILGSIAVCCSDIAIYLLGALGGYSLALFVLSWSDNGVIQSKNGRIIFIIVLTLLGAILTFVFEDAIIILSTALIGAYSIIFGIDLFAHTGFTESVQEFLDGNHQVVYSVDTKVYLMLAGVLALFIIGTIFQWRVHRGEFGRRRAAKSKTAPSPAYSTPPENITEKKKKGWTLQFKK
ncbi:2098_t:CDS:2 [Ambispora leptoticha]|uniref:Transmembrane protein 198 n=1 Tax=Ambispora leptoticha TaxID=144679 RepID=A0A9N8VEM6_9GLOM|nr:2098_t:CDS:2 [Ambispora leptoticha]